MKREIAFKITIDGVEQAINNEQELADAVKLVREEYKKSDFGTEKRAKAVKQLATLKKLQADSRQEIRDLGREFEITESKGNKSYRAINAQLVNARRQYKELSAAERETFGPALLKRIQGFDTELKEIDATLGQFQRNVGNYESAFGGITGALADFGGLDLAALANPAGAVAAVGAAAIAGTAYVKEITAEVRALRGEIQTLTGASGDELDGFTAKAQAIADTFGKSTNEITTSANALASKIGISFESALDRVGTSLAAGLDTNGELLDSVQEYPGFFAEAFGSGERAANIFFEVIKRGNEQGVFSDKAVDSVKEVALRLRELPQTTRDALEAIGLSSDEIAKQIEDEGVGSAIATVSKRLGELRADSPEVGQAVADIFGGAGEDANLDFLISLQDIENATGDLIDTSNEYQVQQQRTLEVNEEFAKAQVEVANAFGDTGASMDNLFTQGQTLLLKFLVPIIERFKIFFGIFSPLIVAFENLGRQFGFISEDSDLLNTLLDLSTEAFRLLIKPIEFAILAISKLVEGYTAVVGAGQTFLRFIGVLSSEQDGAAESSRNMGRGNAAAREELRKLEEQEKKSAEQTKKTKAEIDKLSKSTKESAVVTEAFAKDSLGFLRKELSGLQKDLVGAGAGDERGILEKIVNVESAIKKIEDGRKLIKAAIARTGEELTPILDLNAQRIADGFSPSPDLVIDQVQRSTDVVEQEAEKQSAAFDKLVQDRVAGAKRAADQELEIERRKAALIAEVSSGVFSTFNQINDSLLSDAESRTNEEISLLQERYQAEIEAAEGNTERQEELREELEAAEAEIRQEAFEEQKKYRVASALASLAEGTVNILSRPSVIPDPFGAIFKGVQVAALAASTAIQIGQIQRQRVAAKGTIVDGWIRGESHNGPNGGVSMRLNGQPVLAEAGEYTGTDEFGARAVINKRSAAVHRDLLNDTHGIQFAGKREMYSAINSYKGNGVSFMEAGGVIEPSLESLAMFTGGRPSSDTEIVLSEGSVSAIAQAAGMAVYEGSREGTGEGSAEANRRKERENKLRNRTG